MNFRTPRHHNLKNLLIAVTLPYLVAVTGCSDGHLDNDRDRYKSVFGLTNTPNNSLGTIIGRVLDTNKSPIEDAKVFTTHNQAFVLTNQQGGFILQGLPLERTNLYIIAGETIGSNLVIDLNLKPNFENPEIILTPLASLDGTITAAGAPLSAAQVSLDSSPFTTISDEHGAYHLKAPAGTYDIKVRHPQFIEQVRSSTVIENTSDIDFELAPIEVAPIKIALNSFEPQINRGLEAEFQISTPSNISYIRIAKHAGHFGPNQSILNGEWHSIKSPLIIRHVEPGPAIIVFEFFDKDHKSTKAMTFNYYNTLYDKSWQLIHRTIHSDFTVKTSEKVAFISLPEDQPSHLLHDDAPLILTTTTPTIYGQFKAEKGAVMRGSAEIFGKIIADGTPEQPIEWDLALESPENRGSLAAYDQIQAKHIAFTNGTIKLRAATHDAISLFDAHIYQAKIHVMLFLESWDAQLPFFLSKQTRFERGEIIIECADSKPHHSRFQANSNQARSLLYSPQIVLDNNTFNLFPFKANCSEHLASAFLTIHATSSRFKNLDDNDAYFSMSPKPEYPIKAILFLENNDIEIPERIVSSPDHWQVRGLNQPD